MDSRLLADALILNLAPALPWLVGHDGEKFPEGARLPSDLDKAKALWLMLRQKVEQRPAASEAFQDVANSPEDPDARAALRFQLRKLLDSNQALAAELTSLLDSNPERLSRGAGAVAQGAGGIAVGHVIGGDLIVGAIRAKSRG